MAEQAESVTLAPAPAFDPRIVRAVFFDGFGTLFDYPTARFKRTFGAIAAKLAPAVEAELFWKQWIEAGRRHWGEDGAQGQKARRLRSFETYRLLWRRQMEETFASLNAAGDAEESTDFLFRELVGTPLYSEVRSVLVTVRRRYKIALVSNADDEFLGPPLKASGLSFDAVVSSEMARSYKPEAAIFLKAAEALAVDPGAVLHIGDSARADVEGAVQAGLQAAWLNRDGAEYPEKVARPHLQIANLDDLLPVLGLSHSS